MKSAATTPVVESAKKMTATAAKDTSLKFEESTKVAEVVPVATSKRAIAKSAGFVTVATVMKPKPARTAYIFFCKETVPRLLHEDSKLVLTEAAKKAGAMWNDMSDADKSKYKEAHAQDAERYQKQCEELKTNGFFLLDDGRKSCDVPVLVKVKAEAAQTTAPAPPAPKPKMKTRAVQTGRDLLQAHLKTTTPVKSASKTAALLGKRPRSEKAKSPSPAKAAVTPTKREVSFGKQAISPIKRKKTPEQPE